MSNIVQSNERTIKYTCNGVTRSLAVAESSAQYNRNDRVWEFWPGEYDSALRAGQVIQYPSGANGKRAALLQQLEHEEPEIHDHVQAIISNHGGLIDRAIKAGHIVAAGGVKMAHRHGFHVQSQSKPNKKYWVSGGFDHTPQRCNCMDWWNGNGVHQYGWRVPFAAPFVPGLGCVVCKHILAVLIAETLTPHEDCPTCQGRSFVGFENVQTNLGLQSQCKVCPTCQGTGAQLAPAPEMGDYFGPDDLPPYGGGPGEPMSYEDLPLTDQEHCEMEELRREEGFFQLR